MRTRPALIAMLLAATTLAWAQDTDGDGLSDATEKLLLTDPNFAETLEVVAELPTYTPTPERPARYDLTRVRFGNVAHGRWLWALEFAEPYSFENASIILYVDADNNPATGREGMGCETTYGHRNGAPTQMFYLPEDRRADFPPPRIALQEGILYICADLPLNRQDGRSVFRMSILSEQPEPLESRDSSGWIEVKGPGDSDREKVRTLADAEDTEGFVVTQDMAQLWALQADRANVILNSFRDCAAEGFAYYESEYRWPAMRRTAGEGVLTTTVPRGGRYHLGVVVYDTGGREVYEPAVNDEVVGRFIADADNNRQRLFFTPQPIDLPAGATIRLRAAGSGPSIVEDIMLLARRPQVLTPAKRLEHLEVGWDWDREVMRATWTTTWPVACTLRFGGQEIVEDAPLQNHRVYLPELPAGERVTLTVDAGEAGTHSAQFVAGEPTVAPSSVARATLALTVMTDGREVPAGYPLTTGVPFARGVLGSVDELRLLGPDGAELPLQARPLVRWPDGSIKTVLLDTALPAATADGAALTLEYGREVRRAEVADPVAISREGDALSVSAGGLDATFDLRASALFTVLARDGVPLTDPARPARIMIVDEAGNTYDTLGAPGEITVEEAGPLRAVVRLDGHHTGDAGELFAYQVRLTFLARYPAVQVSYRWVNDRGGQEFTQFNAIRFELPPAVADAPVTIGADEPITGTLAGGVRLEQLYDDRYVVGDERAGRAPGWVSAGDVTLVCADFWQLYPKGLGAEAGALYVDIAPDFPEGQYDDCTERDLYKLYYYLQGGVYKVRQGVSKLHDLWVDLGGTDGDTLAALASEPPVLAAPPQWYADRSVMGQFIPKTAGRTPRYDEVCDRVLRSYNGTIENGHMYGMLNFGDWWGERGANWANGEYDNHHAAAQLFARANDFAWFQHMRNMARHQIDVDLCHWHENRSLIGGAWTHAIGHTGSYLSAQMEGQYGSPRAGQAPCHTWTEGTCEYYMFTGDPTAIEAARMISDHYGGAYLNNYDFNIGRTPGWHLIATMSTWRATGDPFYLNAGRIMIERVLERRTPGSGWERQMVPGHCYCTPRCRGACSFMQGILGVGLREYYRETDDPRVAEAVPDSARYVIEQMWNEEREMFRYTSCPESSYTAGQADTLGGLMLFAWELTDDPRFADIAVRSMNLALDGMGSISHVRWTPYIITVLDRIERERAPGLGGERGAVLMLRNPQAGSVQVHLFDRVGRPAPASAAELTGPDGATARPGEDGRIVLTGAPEGAYRLRLDEHSGPWQVTSSLNPMVASLHGDLELDAAAGTWPVTLHRGAGEHRLSAEVLAGRVSARLIAPSGKVVAQGWEAIGRVRPDEDGAWLLELTGPGRVRLSAQGWAPWTALHVGRWFNASAPNVRIEGRTTPAPGEGRTVELTATVSDPEDDVVGVRWLLPNGRELEGASVRFEPPMDVTELEVWTIAEDAAGNTGEAAVTVRLPEPALADAQGVITVQAEDFSGQGDGEVLVTERIGNVGKMITQWHANIGHWLEWQVQVPAAGDFVLYARYATQSENTRRELTIDGASPGEAYRALAFPSTGGFCTTSDDWATLRLGPPMHLTAGPHIIRMTNLGDGLALDWIALTPAEE